MFLDQKDGDVLTLPARGGWTETVHVFDRDSVDAVNAALAAHRPLLVRGEPGTGKSQLARVAAEALGRAFHSTVVDARTEPRDLLWTFDAVARLAEAQVAGVLGLETEEEVRQQLRPAKFLAPGPLWWAFDWESARVQAELTRVEKPEAREGWREEHGVVLLIDEIDKADASVPNGLLEALGLARFTGPDGRVVSRKEKSDDGVRIPWPLVIVTTNEERSLPDAFLRRCLVLQLGWPSERQELIEALVRRGQAHFTDCHEKVLHRAANQVADDREAVQARRLAPPGGAEYLDLLRAVETLADEEKVVTTLKGKEPLERRLELLRRVGRFVLDKHPAEPPW